MSKINFEGVFKIKNDHDVVNLQHDNQERQSGLKSGGAQRGGAGNFGVFSPQKTYLYIYTFGAGQKKWWCTCTTGTT